MADDAIPAATLIVVREMAGGPPELLMVERAEGMAFAAGAWVFPGGRIDAADRTLADRLGVDASAGAAVPRTGPVGGPIHEERWTPGVEDRRGEKFTTIPDNLVFPATEEKLDGVGRG